MEHADYNGVFGFEIEAVFIELPMSCDDISRNIAEI